MRAALGLAARDLGRVWPNPAVGALIVKDGRIVGRGWTQAGGRPHAETVALRQAGAQAAGATAYVTLEPCCHHGKTPPCSEALIAAGIARVVVPLVDPDPRVSGRGVAALQAGGIAVALDVCAPEARALNRGFFKRVQDELPMVTLKTATTTDSRIATSAGESQWITGEGARAAAHALRATHDAILIGSATAIADDPLLTCRLPGLEERSPVRVLLDARLRTPLAAGLFKTAREVPLWVFTAVAGDDAQVGARRAAGAEVHCVAPDASGHGVDLRQTLGALAGRGITRVLAEAGGDLAAALLRDGLVDELVVFRAPSLLGGDALPMAGALGIAALDRKIALTRTGVRTLGNDLVETYRLWN